MFLALKEMKHEKVRYGMVIAMITLVTYLIFIMTSLALGLAHENTAAIESWKVKSILLNDNANTTLRQSLLTKDQVSPYSQDEDKAQIGETTVILTANGADKKAANFVGIEEDQFIAQDMAISKGRLFKKNYEVVVDDSLAEDGYDVGDSIKLNGYNKTFTIVGFTKGAKLNISPVVYGQLSDWQTLKGTKDFAASAIISKGANLKIDRNGVKSYTIDAMIQKLPGYSAQNKTFIFMIAFLMIISLVIISVFLYIITIQKINNYSVLRAQGIPAGRLMGATLAQSFLLTLVGLVIGIGLTVVTAMVIPNSVPMSFQIDLLSLVSVGMIVMALLGSLIPIRITAKIDPTSIIGG
ncbi:ABC transporter permease [Streptococcus devriesei]|uniref:ABC transporter permease n=1 Tax=Streptococcus devriesei TaxID=231233 RepID=UPI0003FFBF64|nr:FtsX-like permease family protein [Streptococcus devriesei]